MSRPNQNDRVPGALLGLFMGDALAMPVHWYYDRAALMRDYGEVRDMVAPRNPHPDSILFRSSYVPRDPDADILHDQAVFWGRPGVHYHQNLQAGENTLNLRLAQLLLDTIDETKVYDPEIYIERMIAFLRNPQSHNDTYVEEWVREFFDRRAQGFKLHDCGATEKHIGGLAGPTALLIRFHGNPEFARLAAHEHRELTHKGPFMAEALDAVADVLLPVLTGEPLAETIDRVGRASSNRLLARDFSSLTDRDDFEVIGRMLSSACYVEDAVPATFYLARKYSDRPEEGLVANTMAGGDNCYRGAVLGALLGAANGVNAWPERWLSDLRYRPLVAG